MRDFELAEALDASASKNEAPEPMSAEILEDFVVADSEESSAGSHLRFTRQNPSQIRGFAVGRTVVQEG